MSRSHKQLPPLPPDGVIDSPASSTSSSESDPTSDDEDDDDRNNSSGDDKPRINNNDEEALVQVTFPTTPKGLVAAAAAGNEAECRRLIEVEGVYMHGKVRGCSAMMAAAEKGHLNVMKYLEAMGADIKDKNSRKYHFI